jgi:hypothetical protein
MRVPSAIVLTRMMAPHLPGRRWRSRSGRRRRVCRDCPPTAGALRNIGIVARGSIAIVPGLGKGLGLWWSWRSLDNYRRSVRIGIGINWRRIPVPCRTHDPPPAEPTPMPTMEPAAATPDDDIVLMKMIDPAVPKRSRSRLTKSGHRGQQSKRQQSQNYFFHCCLSPWEIFAARP